MATTDGSLCRAMKTFHDQGRRLAVFVIDEQHEDPPRDYVKAQREVLNTAHNAGMAIWQIELNPTIGGAQPQPNLPTFSLLVLPEARLLSKRTLNAFAEPTHPGLHQSLTVAQIDTVVVMGYHKNCCVRLTAVGGPERPGGQNNPGATGNGYQVLTSEAILRPADEAASWADENNVTFYSRV